MKRILFILALLLPVSLSAATGTDYALKAQKIAEDTYLFEGLQEDFSFTNGGNIVNVGIIITDEGVVVIDSGPSVVYGEQLKKAIAALTDKPISLVINTHMHPDHYLGNQAFEGVPIAALAGTERGMRETADDFTDNMYRLVGRWMAGTEPLMPTMILKPGVREVGGHRLNLMSMSGHTDTDLVIFDETTGVVFAGDLLFHHRAPTTPHANISGWLKSLQRLAGLKAKVWVPGHGPVAHDTRPIQQTGNYLRWLQKTLDKGATEGLDMAEMLHQPLPADIAEMSVMPDEYRRSLSHLYGGKERDSLGEPISRPE